MREGTHCLLRHVILLIILNGLFSNSLAAKWVTEKDEAIMKDLMNSPNVTDPSSACNQINGLSKKHMELCYHSPAIIMAIGEGNRRTLEHLEQVFEDDHLPSDLLIYNNLFSFRLPEGSKREIVYLASIQSSAIAHELALVCSDGMSDAVCPCYRPPSDTDSEFSSVLGTPLVLDQGCPYALAHAQRIALDYILENPGLTADTRQMIKEHTIAAVKSIEAGWIDPEEEWESKFRELDERASQHQQKRLGAGLHQHGEL